MLVVCFSQPLARLFPCTVAHLPVI
jgi:hypothetical protein